MWETVVFFLVSSGGVFDGGTARAFQHASFTSGNTVTLPAVPLTGGRFISEEPQTQPLPTSKERESLVNGLESRIADWIKQTGDDDGEWVADRARLEMQLATARLELAAAELIEARKESDLRTRKSAVMASLRLVQDVDRTLDRVNIERLDDFDRRAYRSLTAMRHRVSSLQIHALLGMVGEVDQAKASVPDPDSNAPSITPPPRSPDSASCGPKLHYYFDSPRRCRFLQWCW